jgi:PAS domain S-box-containing protein
MVRSHGLIDDSRFEQIVRLSGEGIWTIDVDGLTDFINESGAAILGYQSGELIGRDPAELLFPEDRASLATLFEALRAGKPGSGETSYLRGDGMMAWVRFRTCPLLDDRGGYGGAVSMFTDITERKRMDRRSKESEDKFRSVLDSSLDAVYRLNLQAGRYEYVGPAFERVAGRPAEELLSKDVEEALSWVHPDDIAGVRAALDRLLETGAVEYDYRLRGRDGRYRWISNHFTVVRDVAGRPLYRDGVVRDVTEQKLAEQALRESESRYRSLFESMHGPVTLWRLILDADGEVIDRELVDANPAALNALAARSIDDVRGKRDSEIYGAETAARLLEIAKLVRRTGKPSVDERHLEADGRDYQTNYILQGDQCIISTSVDITEVKRSQRRAEESAAVARERAGEIEAIMDAVPATIFIARDPGCLTMFGNRAVERLLQVPPNANISASAPGIERPADFRICRDGKVLEPEDQPMQVASHTGLPVEGTEFELRFDDGRSVWLYGNTVPLLDEAGAPRGAVGAFLDISERKLAEREAVRVRQKNELFADVAGKLLVSDRPQEIIEDLADRTMRFLDCDYFFNYFVDEKRGGITLNASSGISDEEVKGRGHLDLGAAICGLVALEGRRMAVGDIMARDDDRTSFHRSQGIQAYACHPLIVGGRTIGTLSFGTKSRKSFSEEDLSVMKAVADQIALAMKRVMDSRAIAESEERLRMATEAADMFTYEYDVRTREIRFSDNYVSVVGWQPPATLNEMVRTIHPDDQRLILESRERLEHDGGDRLDYEYRSFASPYQVRWFHAWNRVIRDAGGVPERIVSIIQDVTERRRAEENLKRSNADLQHFAHIASHDLQEPLRMVTLFTDLLIKRLGSDLDPKDIEYMSYISEGAMRMRSLINDLLAYSRVDSQPLDVKEVDLSEIVGLVLEDLSVPVAESGTEVIVHPVPVVLADELKIKQVLQNIISNAIKFNTNEKPVVEVSAQRLTSEVIVAVKDNGIGIDPKYREKVFEMFQRLHTREEYPGTGVGLAISRKIIERHGGRIWFESVPGEGSTFLFTLPLQTRPESG